ncbi:putative lipid II flippase FtsW [Deltaproteobacteria bacterium]|nr:putative lipid II flippase FtsW [Deltaproteobacteria bacterium]
MTEDRSTPFDALLLVLILGLSLLGLVMLLSASSIMAEQRFGDADFFFRPQARNMIIGLVLMLVMARIPYQIWPRLAYPILGVTLVCLALVLTPGFGHGVSGANRWLRLPGFTFQPSEAAKLAMVIYLAYSLSRKGEKTASFLYGLLPHLLVLSLTVGLILVEPDLGTAVCVAMVAFILMFVAGIKVWHMAVLGLGAAAVVYYEITSYAYRLRRIAAFLDPWADPQGSGYHIIHSFYAFAAGGFLGQGPGGSQQKLFFLPEPHTDFIFSVLAEEVGLAGVVVVVLLFLALVGRGLTIARSARDFSGLYLGLGATLLVGVPAFLNMAVVTALIPTKGLPLPFFSYGGTNLLVCYAAMGILLNVSGQSQGERPKMPRRSFPAARAAA